MSKSELIEVPENRKKKFTVVGIVTSTEYQKCKFYVQKLVKSFPKEYEPPVLRPMLNVEWMEYLWKIRRNIGGKVWTLEKNAVVLLDNEFLGDDMAIFNYVTKKARIRIAKDFYCLGILELTNILNKITDNKRKLAYLTIAIDDKCIGTLLFMLYADIVPRTVSTFIRRCKSKRNGWLGTPIHRLVKGSWLQLGDFTIKNHHIPCENYIVPHDRRGVLSTCNEEKHTNNSTQLIISLAPTPWMDYKFVAFGQLIQGEEVLKKIESIQTDYESPKQSIKVIKCDEFTLDTTPDEETQNEIKTYLEKINSKTGLPNDVLDPRDVPSDLSVGKYEQGYYCHDLDLEPHPGLNQWHLYYATAREPQPPVPEDNDVVKFMEVNREDRFGDFDDKVIRETEKDIEKRIRKLLNEDILNRVIGKSPSGSIHETDPETLKIITSVVKSLFPEKSQPEVIEEEG